MLEKQLAEQSDIFATQIAQVVQVIQHETNQTKEIFVDISATIHSMTTELTNITNINKKITAHLQKVTDAVEEVNIIARQNNENSTKVSAASQEQFASIEEISNSTNSLSELAKELKKLTNYLKI